MTFLYPLGFLGLLSLPVILALHLLHQRKRRYVVSHLKLWAFIDTEMAAPRTRRIPITTILLLDLLIAALLTLAWAQPQLTIPLPLQNARHRIYLLDVSSSMAAQDGVSTRFGRAKAELLELLERRGPKDVITIGAFGRSAHILSDSRTDSYPEMVEKINRLAAGETGAAIEMALALAISSVDPSLEPEFTVITDGNYPVQRLDELNHFTYPLNWRFIGAPLDNQAVVEFNVIPVGSRQRQFFVRVANFGGQPASRELVLELDGRIVSRVEMNLPADTTQTHVWKIALGPDEQIQAAAARLQGADSLPADDSSALGLQQSGVAQVLLVAENPAILQQAVRAIPGTQLTVVTPQEYSASQDDLGRPSGFRSRFDLIIFRNFTPEVWPVGNVLVVEPPGPGADQAGIPVSGGPDLTASSRQEIPANIPLRKTGLMVSDIDFSGVRWVSAWKLDNTPSGFLPLLLANDLPLLLAGEINASPEGSSHVTVLLADLSRGNFTKHPAYPILMANLVEQAHQVPLPPSIQTGEAIRLPAAGRYQSLEITPPDNAPAQYLQDWPADYRDTTLPGLYHFTLSGDDNQRLDISVGARAGDVVESNLRPRDWTLQASNRQASRAETITEQQQEIDLRPWLLGLVLLVMVVEAFPAWRR